MLAATIPARFETISVPSASAQKTGDTDKKISEKGSLPILRDREEGEIAVERFDSTGEIVGRQEISQSFRPGTTIFRTGRMGPRMPGYGR